MKISEIIGQFFKVLKQDKLVAVPYVAMFLAMGLLEARGFKFAARIESFHPSKLQMIYFAATTLISELVWKNLTIGWTAQILRDGVVSPGIGSVGVLLKRFFHLVMVILTLVVPAVLLGAGIAMIGTGFTTILLAVVAFISVMVWILVQFSSHYILFENDPFWRAMIKSVLFVRTHLNVVMNGLIAGIFLVLFTGMFGAIVMPIPAVGGVLQSILEGIGAAGMIIIQTYIFVTIRSKYTSVA